MVYREVFFLQTHKKQVELKRREMKTFWKEYFHMTCQEIYCYGQELAHTQKGQEICVRNKPVVVIAIRENLGRKSQAFGYKPVLLEISMGSRGLDRLFCLRWLRGFYTCFGKTLCWLQSVVGSMDLWPALRRCCPCFCETRSALQIQ